MNFNAMPVLWAAAVYMLAIAAFAEFRESREPPVLTRAEWEQLISLRD